ncbi:MAG TPA: glucose 1-dehydrogenase [Mycobacteriales bacterium]|nr:glucose 1-dehydrogenase [Mycobacteriales bacterium]
MNVLSRFRLDGLVAIVTGASSGLGVAFAESLAEAGADVALGARRVDRMADTAKLVESHGRRAIVVQTDVSDPEACRALVAATVEQLGRLDVLVNNAGVGTSVPASKETPDQFRAVLDVNLHGAYWMAQAAAQAMVDGGSIVNISSVLGLTRSDLPQAAYASSKAGLIGLTRDLASQWATRKNIRVNALAPGFFASEMSEPLIANDHIRQSVLARTPLGRLGEPEELCAALLLLASDAGSYITGITLPVDGGWTMP